MGSCMAEVTSERVNSNVRKVQDRVHFGQKYVLKVKYTVLYN